MTNRKNEFSFMKGYSFIFESDGHLIETWCSTLTGAEKIFVDGTLVSKKRTIKRQSQTDFFVDGYSSVFSIDLNAVSILKGPFVCTLLKDGIPIQRKRLAFPHLPPSKTYSRFAVFLLLGAVLGAGLGMAAALLQWPTWVIAIIAVLFALIIIPITTIKPVIEEEII